MIRKTISRIPLLALLVGIALPSLSEAVDRCRVRVGRDGTIEILASKVTGVAVWGDASDDVTQAIVDPGTCTAKGRLRKCLIGAQGSPESKVPPAGCELFLADDGPDTCSAQIRGCTPGVRYSNTHEGAIYRWMVFNSYGQAYGQWYGGNNADLFGGVLPSVWGDGNGLASQMSSDKEVLRTLFTRKGYGGKNATVVADEWQYNSSTNSRHVATLFRVRNTTPGDLVWTVDVYQTGYASWSERASVALNGVLVWESAGDNLGPHQSQTHALTIPADRTSTVILLSASTSPNGTRSAFMAFHNDTLELPPGLEYVDDLDEASGGWDE